MRSAASFAARLPGGDPVLVQPPHRRQRLVERGAVARRVLVAVPAAVRPLPLDERLREQPDARVVRKPEPAADRQGVPLLRAAPPDEPVDRLDPAPVALPGQPREHGLGRGDAAGLAGRDAELDERDEPPVRAAPLGVDVDAETAVGLLTREERPYLRPFEDAGRPQVDPPRRAGRASPGRRSPARPSRAASPAPMPSPSCQLLREQVEQQSVAPDAVRIAPILAHHADGSEAHLLVAADRVGRCPRPGRSSGGGGRDRRSGGAPPSARRRRRGRGPGSEAERKRSIPAWRKSGSFSSEYWISPASSPSTRIAKNVSSGSSPRAFLPQILGWLGPRHQRTTPASAPISASRGTSASASGRSTTRSPRNSMTVL